MLGLMQDRPLALPHVFHRAEQYFGHKSIVTADARPARPRRPSPSGRSGCAGWPPCSTRSTSAPTAGWRRSAGTPAGTWSSTWPRPCTGRVLHTLNIRLFPEQLVYIANHAEDEVVFVDRSLLPLFWPLVDKLETRPARRRDRRRRRRRVPPTRGVHDYEELLAAAEPFEGRFEIDDENQRRGHVLHAPAPPATRRAWSTATARRVLHSLITLTADGARRCPSATWCMPVVPMFHANAWGLPYGCLLAGSTMVFPGPNMTPQAIARAAGAAPRHGHRRACRRSGWACCRCSREHDLSALRRDPLRRVGRAQVAVGGLPEALGRADPARLGHDRDQSRSPPCAARARQHDALDRRRAGRRPRPAGPGRPAGGPADGRPGHRRAAAVGRRRDAARSRRPGPWIAAEYYRGEGGGAQFTDDGWLRTGDVAAVDRYGFVRIVDRTKDLIKSGGEWIGSVELENEIMAHPKVAEAAVIAIPHEKWVERPLACVVVKPGETLTAEEVLAHLEPRVARGGCPTPWSSSTRCPRPASASSPRGRCGRSSPATSSRTVRPGGRVRRSGRRRPGVGASAPPRRSCPRRAA